MATRSRTVILKRRPRTPIATAFVLLTALCSAYGLITLALSFNHALADSVLAAIPAPGPARSLASDPALLRQLRVDDAKAYFIVSSDHRRALVLETSVTNHGSVPLESVVIEARASLGNRTQAVSTTPCGRNVSPRLLRRLTTDQLLVLRDLDPGTGFLLRPQEKTRCQATFPALRRSVENVSYRVVSARPLPHHHR